MTKLKELRVRVEEENKAIILCNCGNILDLDPKELKFLAKKLLVCEKCNAICIKSYNLFKRMHPHKRTLIIEGLKFFKDPAFSHILVLFKNNTYMCNKFTGKKLYKSNCEKSFNDIVVENIIK